MIRVLLIFSLIFTATALFGEEPQAEELQVRPLNVSVKQDPKIDWLMQAYSELVEEQKGIPGFRIQVAVESGNQSRVRIQKSKYEFDEAFPGVKSYIDYDAPYYKLRVGDFRTRLDARRFMKKITREYRNAFIVVDQINFPDFD